MFLRRVEWGCKNHPLAFARAALEATLSPLWGLHFGAFAAQGTDGIHLSEVQVPCNLSYDNALPPTCSCNTDCHLSVDVIHFTNYCTPPTPP